jgi:hypothetical protein
MLYPLSYGGKSRRDSAIGKSSSPFREGQGGGYSISSSGMSRSGQKGARLSIFGAALGALSQF